jgi:uncharacterized protein
MPIVVNLRHLEAHNVTLAGELPSAELDIDTRDAMLRVTHPVQYELEVQKMEAGLLVTGRLRILLDCHCVRCLKAFTYELTLPDWTLHLPLQGEEAVPVSNDSVDLTPYVREDILLEFPPHPLCEAECRGLPPIDSGKARHTSGSEQLEAASPAWNELNKLKF